MPAVTAHQVGCQSFSAPFEILSNSTICGQRSCWICLGC